MKQYKIDAFKGYEKFIKKFKGLGSTIFRIDD